MVVAVKLMEKKRPFKVDDFLELLDALHNGPVADQSEKEIPTGEEMRERAILLTMLGL